jgi:hypothetical protein
VRYGSGHLSVGLGMYFFVMIITLSLALLAVLGVFIEIPFVSSYAFWVATAAYVILASAVAIRSMSFSFALVIALLAVVGVFIYIPFVSDYAFWVMIAAYLFLVSSVSKLTIITIR